METHRKWVFVVIDFNAKQHARIPTPEDLDMKVIRLDPTVCVCHTCYTIDFLCFVGDPE